jgi:hypothetical protein
MQLLLLKGRHGSTFFCNKRNDKPVPTASTRMPAPISSSPNGFRGDNQTFIAVKLEPTPH